QLAVFDLQGGGWGDEADLGRQGLGDVHLRLGPLAGPELGQEAGGVVAMQVAVQRDEIESAADAVREELGGVHRAVEKAVGGDDQPVLAGVQAEEAAQLLAGGSVPESGGSILGACQGPCAVAA